MLDYQILFPHLEENEQLGDVFDRLPQLDWDHLFRGMPTSRFGNIHPLTSVANRVSVGENTVIHPFAVIEDDVIIGKNCEIRSGALIRSKTIIGDGVVIGHAAEIKHAFVCNDAKIQGHTFVGDSIIGKGARVGTGTILSNRRFDQASVAWRVEDEKIDSRQDKIGALVGDYVRLGAHVTTNPGSIIGAMTWVASGNMINGFVGAKKFVTADGVIVHNEKAKILLTTDEEGNA